MAGTPSGPFRTVYPRISALPREWAKKNSPAVQSWEKMEKIAKVADRALRHGHPGPPYAPAMIHPAPTSKIDPALARGTFVETIRAMGNRPEMVSLAFPNTSYQMHLVPTSPVSTEPGSRVLGTIRGKCRRIDVVGTGGKYVEPVIGRPRRVQGKVIKITGDSVVVDAGVPVHCTPTDPRQKPGDFQVGQLVSFDVLEGATLTPGA